VKLNRTADRPVAQSVSEQGVVQERTGNPFTVALNCPSCGGSISFAEGSTRVVCAHCRLAHMVVGRKGELRYWIPARLEGAQAARRVGSLLEKARDGRTVHFVDSQLVYVPFFRVKVTGGGWYIGRAEGTAYTWTQTGNQQSVVTPRKVTRNIVEGFFRDISFFVPALDISELGLIGIWAKSTALELVPFDSDAISGGIVYTPLKESKTAAEEAWATLIASVKPAQMAFDYFEADKVTEEISMIYYPVWIIRFLIDGAPRRTVVDGLGGDIKNIAVPAKVRVAAAPGVVTLAAITLLATTLPILLVIPCIAALYYIIFNGWSWFWDTIVRLFFSPWRGQEEILG
jgi:hypothetical protein